MQLLSPKQNSFFQNHQFVTTTWRYSTLASNIIIYIYIYILLIWRFYQRNCHSLLANSFSETLGKRLFSFITRMVILFATYFQMWLFVSQYTLSFLRNGFFRSSHQRSSVKNGVLRNFTKFTGKHLGQRLFFKVAGLNRDSGTGFFLWILRNF